MMRLWLLAIALVASPALAQQNLLPPEASADQDTQPPAATDAPTALVSAPPASGEDVDEEPEEQTFSYGDAPFSLMFTTEQVTAMKNVLSSVEARSSKPATTAASSTGDDLQQFLATTKPKISGEPAIYPVFYLSSIVYRSPMDWAVWMGGQRITPRNNEGALEVVGVAADSVTFHWKPDFMPSLVRRQQDKQFAPVDKIRNRLTVKETVSFDDKEGVIIFTLRPNQSFSSGHMSTFEGKVQPASFGAPESTLPGSASTKTPADGKLSDAAKSLLSDMAGDRPSEEVQMSPPPSPAAAALDEQAVNTIQQLLKSQKSLTTTNPGATTPVPESP